MVKKKKRICSQLHGHIPPVPVITPKVLFLNITLTENHFYIPSFVSSLWYFHSSKIKDIFLVASNRKLNWASLDRKGNFLAHVTKLWGRPQASCSSGHQPSRAELPGLILLLSFTHLPQHSFLWEVFVFGHKSFIRIHALQISCAIHGLFLILLTTFSKEQKFYILSAI